MQTHEYSRYSVIDEPHTVLAEGCPSVGYNGVRTPCSFAHTITVFPALLAKNFASDTLKGDTEFRITNQIQCEQSLERL
jgi:hypothetical protein